MRFLSVLFCFVLAFGAKSQKYSFVAYSTEEGLPQTQVTSICQDSLGYLWIGTLGGLAKFNGSEFTTYSSNDGLINNRIATIAAIGNRLWVGHDGGVSMIDKNHITNIAFSGNDKSRKVSDIVEFNNQIVICTDGGGIFKLEGKKVKRIDLPTIENEYVRDAYVQNGVLYLATRGGVLKSNDLKTFKAWSELGNHSFSSIRGNDDYLLLTSFNWGVYKMDLKTSNLIKISPDKLRYPINGSYIDNRGQVWLNSQNGIILIDKQNQVSFLDESNGLPVNMISCFYQDKDKNMWIGSEGKGIFRFPGNLFKYYDQSTGLLSDLYLSGFQRQNGDFVFGTYDKGLVIQKKNGTIEGVNIGNNTIWAALESVDGRDWFGTQNSLVSIDRTGKIETYDFNDNLPGNKITALYKIDNASMYVGGSEGAAIYRNGSFKLLGKPEDEFIGTVRDFEVIANQLYCVTNLGIFVYSSGSFKPLAGAELVVYNIEKDEFGNFWYGTEEGLFRWSNGKSKRINLLRDPASNFINFLNVRNGELYVGSNNGLFVVSNLNADTPKIIRYGKSEGVIDLETNLNSGFFDRQGDFWFGTASGLICFHTQEKGMMASNPTLHLKSILLNYEAFDYNKYTDELTAIGLPKNLNLPYFKNNLMIVLDGVSLVHHEGLQYQFLLEGISDDWSPLTDNPTITFSSLPAGAFNLRVRAVDVDGRMSDEVVLPFVINQAFYKTWWFIGLCGLLVFVLVVTIFRFRLKRIREHNEKEKLEIKTRLLTLEQKSINASMNRHFIFNALNSIQYFINTQDRLSANKYLTNFAQLIRKNLDSATSDNNMISLEEELARIKLYLSLESMRFKDKFEYSISVEDVDAESVMLPSMIMQPFVENSIIHGVLPNEGVRGQINIVVKRVGNELHIFIEDNGIGVNNSLKQKSKFDGDHRSQGMEITTKRIELLRKISQIGISLDGPVEIVGNNGLINGTRVLIKLPLDNLES